MDKTSQENTSKVIDQLFDEIKRLEAEKKDLEKAVKYEKGWSRELSDTLIRYKAHEDYLLHVFDQMLKRTTKIMDIGGDNALGFSTQCFALVSEVHKYLTAVYNEGSNTLNL